MEQDGLRKRTNVIQSKKDINLNYTNESKQNKNPIKTNDTYKLLKSKNYDNSIQPKYVSYSNQIPFARFKKPESRFVHLIELGLVILAIMVLYLNYHYSEHLHVPITKLYAHIGVKVYFISSKYILINNFNQMFDLIISVLFLL